MNDTETWKSVERFPGYDVSDRGRVRSYFRRGRPDIGPEPTHLLKQVISPPGGYHVVNLKLADGRRRLCTVHALVAEAFLGPRPDRFDVCHVDRNPLNNRVENLRYDTRQENNRDSLRTGESGIARLSRADLPVIMGRLAAGETCASIAKEYGVSRSTISMIKRGRTWNFDESERPRPEVDIRDGIRPPGELTLLVEEVWRPVPNYLTYDVSNHGRVRSRKSKSGWKPAKTRLLKLNFDAYGYHFVALSERGKVKTMKVHRLVLLAFVGPCPDGMVCCHDDGNRSNNRLANLRWDTVIANARDRIASSS